MKYASSSPRHPRVRMWLITLAIVFLCNPTVRLFDILPDFIACFIIAHYLSYPSLRAPFFSEARRAFLKLGAVSLMRIPAFIISVNVRSSNAYDYDTTVLLTFVFAVIEGIYLISALSNLFSAFFYLGERSDASSLITGFTTSVNKIISPESLRSYSIFAVIFKLAAWSLPEFLLLTQGVDLSAYSQVIRPASMYPLVIVLSVIFSFFVMLILGLGFYSYILNIHNEGKFFFATDSLITAERKSELSAKIIKKDINGAFTLITVSALFSVVLRFDNLREINLMPFMLCGVLIIAAIFKMSQHAYLPKITVLCGALFTLSALAAQIIESVFLDTYSYEMLVKNKLAKAEYIPVIISSAVCCAAFIIFIIFLSVFLNRFSALHTGFAPQSKIDEKYMKLHKRAMKRKICFFSVSAILVPVTRLCDTVFKYFPSLKIVSVEDGFGNVTFSLIPWFGVAVFASSALFFAASIYLGSVFKDELDIKYSEDF